MSAPPKLGVFTPQQTLSQVDAFEELVGREQEYYMYFLDWRFSIDPVFVQSIIDRGTTPIITWEPFEESLVDIAGGTEDAFLEIQAGRLASVSGDVILRPMHEMNGHWYPWGYTYNGNTPQQYIDAFRHIVTVFRANGAGNVKFMWTPNIEGPPSWDASTFPLFFPGDEYIDYTGMSGYNWGDGYLWTDTGAVSSWRSPGSLFTQSYLALTTLSDRPVFLAETSSAEESDAPGIKSKAVWIAELFTALREDFPRISAVIWFNQQKERDWRVNSSAESLVAYKWAIDDGAPSHAAVTIDGGAEFTGDTAADISLSASDRGSGVALMRSRIDSSEWSGWGPFAASAQMQLPPAEGPHVVESQFADYAGNTSDVVSDDVELDMTSPSGSIVIGAGAAATKDAEVALRLSAQDSRSGVTKMRVAGSRAGLSTVSFKPYSPSGRFTLTGADGDKEVWVQFKDAAGNLSAAVKDGIMLDRTAPAGVRMTGAALSQGFQKRSGFAVSWEGSDASSGVRRYDVRFTRATYQAGWTRYYRWKKGGAERTADFSGRPGRTYCFRVRAEDEAGNLSAFSAPRCTAIPLRSTSLVHGKGWHKRAGSGFYGGTYSKSVRKGSELTLPAAFSKHLAIVAATCPKCGGIQVYRGKKRIATISLRSPEARRTRIIALKGTPLTGGGITLKSASSGRPVYIEGLGVSRK